MARTPDDLSRDMAECRDLLLEVIAAHEDADHDGDMCPTERFNALAFLAHCLGLKPTPRTFSELDRLIRYYDHDCTLRGGCDVHPNGHSPSSSSENP